jgi:hypothetical protein
MRIRILIVIILSCIYCSMGNSAQLLYSTYFGGSAIDFGNGIALDNEGNIYITGQTNSADFPTSLGAYDVSTNGSYDIFVSKLNPNFSGVSSLIYSTFIGGTVTDWTKSIAVDTSGNAYITGVTLSSDFPTTSTAFDTVYHGFGDIFVTKLNPNGSTLIYSTYLGGVGIDTGIAIVVDNIGDAYITGRTESPDFPVTLNAFDTIFNNNSTYNANAFITKINANGTGLVYSTYLGGFLPDDATGIAIDNSGNSYVAGRTQSTDFPVTLGAFDMTTNGFGDIFISKINNTGTSLVYSTYIGGSYEDYVNGFAIDNNENAYITGYTMSLNYPVTPNAYDTVFNNGTPAPYEMYITKLNAAGSNLIYSTFFGGDIGGQSGRSIVADNIGNAYITGNTNSPDFPLTIDAVDTVVNAGIPGQYADAFISKINSSGTAVLYSTFFGGSSQDQGSAITLDNAENVYLMGWTQSTEIPITSNAYNTSSHGYMNPEVYLCKVHIPTVITTIVEQCFWQVLK